MSKTVNALRIILLLMALIGVVRLMRYLDENPSASSSFFHTLLGTPVLPKPLEKSELPAPISEALSEDTQSLAPKSSNPEESNESQ